MLGKSEKFSLPEIEEKVLKFWRENQIFEKSLALRKSRGKKFVFYEGPPYANGKPGIHHVLARVYKDIILRYKTMRGFYVPRKAGWDTHGLPVEMAAEKSLGLKFKKDIEKFGVGLFNKKAKELVWLYKKEWEEMTERIGYWLDLKNAYVTYENKYIETLWWILKRLWEKKLLYQGKKVVPWCTRCGTALSSHELAQGYKEVSDTSVYVKFYVPSLKAYILSWTTTPWTLPGNVALAVGEKIDYVRVKVGKDFFVLAKKQLSILGESPEIMEEFKGKKLVGLSYEPLFKIPSLKSKNSYKIYAADFVNTDEGTGVVHTAVMYGEDDYALGKKVGLPEHHTVNEQGKFTAEVPGLAGLYVKDKKTEEKIINQLKTKNLLLKTESYTHEYPFCWRCDTPVIYYARNSWFIAMSKLRKELLKNNEKINWVPAHIKNGRFGEWLKEAKDWNLSRERYWGTPLPIWECKKCEHKEIIGSREELSDSGIKAKNSYFVLRHGQALNNTKNVVNSDPKDKNIHPLTLRGRAETEKLARKLKSSGQKFDLILSSDFKRAKETAEIISKTLGVKVQFDKRLREINTGVFNGKSGDDYNNYFSSYAERFEKKPEGGENLRDVALRVFNLIRDLESKHRNKTILFVSHENPLWMFETVAGGWSEIEAVVAKEKRIGDFIKNSEFKKIEWLSLPRNESGFGDLHRPYIDEITLKCKKCGGKMKRVKEVADVWFDSGAMPFAQGHRPFDLKTKLDFPADYISEAIDQTRGWFYTLLAVATALGLEPPYKNVICLGLVNDKNGQKMSKSKGNIVEPFTAINKYGVDAVRWYFYVMNPPGESKNFDENEILKSFRRFHLILYNSFIFYKTYAIKNTLQTTSHKLRTSNILDIWITARLNETIASVSHFLDSYEVREAALILGSFVDDLSRWYIRRSRRRFQKPENQTDYKAASETLGSLLLETSKLIAPFTPFFAEGLYKSLKKELSVHLADWPTPNQKSNLKNQKLLKDMEETRHLASLALAKRAEVGIKVRQPLQKLTTKNLQLKTKKELLNILKDEINVKEISFDAKLAEEIELDTNITNELREEGRLREFIRIVQDIRQDAKLEPKDTIVLSIEAPEEIKYVLEKNEKLLKREINAKNISYKRTQKFKIELETKLENWQIWLAIDRIK